MKTIVITGSTRGIGYHMAKAFLARGHAVVINGRSDSSVTTAVETLSKDHDPGRIAAHPADVSHYEEVQSLWDAAVNHFKRVDIWINNAGLGNVYKSAWQQDPALLRSIVEANLLGTINGTHVAYNAMIDQGGGQIFNMEGFGSNGRKRAGLTVYGSTKYAVAYFTRSFLDELPGNSPVKLGTLSPGMVTTDLLLDAFEDPVELEESKRIFNIIADKPETVSPWLVDQILSTETQGAEIRWLTTPKLMWRFLTAPFQQRDLFA